MSDTTTVATTTTACNKILLNKKNILYPAPVIIASSLRRTLVRLQHIATKERLIIIANATITLTVLVKQRFERMKQKVLELPPELLNKAKRTKTGSIINAVFIGFLIGINFIVL